MNPLSLDPAQPRRDFLKKLAATGAAALLTPGARLRAAEAVPQPQATADACIILWMGGGDGGPGNL